MVDFPRNVPEKVRFRGLSALLKILWCSDKDNLRLNLSFYLCVVSQEFEYLKEKNMEDDYDSGWAPDDQILERYMTTGEGSEYFDDDTEEDDTEDEED